MSAFRGVLCILRTVRCGLTGPAEAQLFCYVNHLLVCLVRAAQRAWRRKGSHSFSCSGLCTRVVRGMGCWPWKSHRPVGTALPCRQDQGNLQGKGSCHECNYDRIIPAFPLAWAPQVQVVSELEWSQQAAYQNWSHLEYCIAPAETMASVSSFAHHCHFPVKVVTNQGVNSLKRGQQLCPDMTASPSAPEWHDKATWSR